LKLPSPPEDFRTMDIDPASPSPRTSTRDRTELRARLEAWLESQYAGARITDFSAPTANGMSSETLLFTAIWADEGIEGRHRCVARLPPAADAVPIFPVYDLEKQSRVMRIARERTELPVPRVLWYEADAAHLGAPFIVMERMDGEAPPDVPPYVFDSWLLRAGPELQAQLQSRAIGVIADLHRVALTEDDIAYLRASQGEGSALRRHVEAQREFYAWVCSDGIRLPVIERGFEWLEAHWPDNEHDEVLSWGDARIGNMLFTDFRPSAILDWEMAATGPREMDLGWMIYLHHFFQDFTPLVGLPGIPGMMGLDSAAATYASASGHRPRNLEIYAFYAALRHGILMSRTARRGILFGETTMPADPDDLVMHRASLEAMMAGTYWDSRR
jgi:aminoglycoside phosphotransferase (APT) family kinase protein